MRSFSSVILRMRCMYTRCSRVGFACPRHGIVTRTAIKRRSRCTPTMPSWCTIHLAVSSVTPTMIFRCVDSTSRGAAAAMRKANPKARTSRKACRTGLRGLNRSGGLVSMGRTAYLFCQIATVGEGHSCEKPLLRILCRQRPRRLRSSCAGAAGDEACNRGRAHPFSEERIPPHSWEADIQGAGPGSEPSVRLDAADLREPQRQRLLRAEEESRHPDHDLEQGLPHRRRHRPVLDRLGAE